MYVQRKVIGDLDPKFIKLFNDVALRAISAFCHFDGFEPFIAFSVKNTRFTDEKGGRFDGVVTNTAIYTTKSGVFPRDPINYIDLYVGGLLTNIAVAPSPSICESMVDGSYTSRAQCIAQVTDEYFTVFIECVDATNIRRCSKDGQVSRKDHKMGFSELELRLFDRVKAILATRLMSPGDFVLVNTTLDSLYPSEYTDLLDTVFNIGNRQKAFQEKIAEVFSSEK